MSILMKASAWPEVTKPDKAKVALLTLTSGTDERGYHGAYKDTHNMIGRSLVFAKHSPLPPVFSPPV